MRVTAIFALAILCITASAVAVRNLNECMYDKVSRMTEQGQKLAFFLTRTAIVSSEASQTTATSVRETTSERISSFSSPMDGDLPEAEEAEVTTRVTRGRMLRKVTKDVAKRLAEVKAWYETAKKTVQNTINGYRKQRKLVYYPSLYKKLEQG